MTVTNPSVQGISLRWRPEDEPQLQALLLRHGLPDQLQVSDELVAGEQYRCLRLHEAAFDRSLPDFDSIGLAARLQLDTHSEEDLEREILLTLLGSPLRLEFPSLAELLAALHIRRNIVQAGRCTSMDFHTEEADRPADCWRDDEENGFVILPGHSLIEALRKATQPQPGGRLYAFSCYRATEYVILLGLAEELAICNPELFARLQAQCEKRMIRSGQFHEVFLREYGSQEMPMPARYYVPGDRVWFRNPDEASADVTGFEGSWVIYLGGGLFTNFWKCDQPYSLAAKCLEIYHWRHGLYRAENGEPAMDESIVERRVAETLANPDEHQRILSEMLRWRESRGCYGNGGCIDTTREGPRWVCPGSSDLVLPAE